METKTEKMQYSHRELLLSSEAVLKQRPLFLQKTNKFYTKGTPETVHYSNRKETVLKKALIHLSNKILSKKCVITTALRKKCTLHKNEYINQQILV